MSEQEPTPTTPARRRSLRVGSPAYDRVESRLLDNVGLDGADIEANIVAQDNLRANTQSDVSEPFEIIDNRLFNREEAGIHVSGKEFVVDPLTDEQKSSLATYEAAEAAKIEARLSANPTNSADTPVDSPKPGETTPSLKKGEKNVKSANTTKEKVKSEKETNKEQKERIKPEKSWFKRVGEAAITNFLTLRKVGVVDFVTDKLDTARENVSGAFETFTDSLSKRYAKARKNLEELSGKSDEAVKKLLTNRAEALKSRAARLEKRITDRESNKANRKENRAKHLQPFEEAADKNAEAIARRATARRLGKRGVDSLTTAA